MVAKAIGSLLFWKAEMNSRADWIGLPVFGILRIIRDAGEAGGEKA